MGKSTKNKTFIKMRMKGPEDPSVQTSGSAVSPGGHLALLAGCMNYFTAPGHQEA